MSRLHRVFDYCCCCCCCCCCATLMPGHFFGLPDLYDTSYNGRGIGSFGIMSNSWGETGTQLNPPMFSPWSKIALGWLTPTEIQYSTDAGVYELCSVGENQDVLKITFGFESENKRVCKCHFRVLRTHHRFFSHPWLFPTGVFARGELSTFRHRRVPTI